MESFQRERGGLMVEIYHAIHSIMAYQAVLAIIMGMVNHENGILCSMAAHAA
jgi:hypothetical protein